MAGRPFRNFSGTRLPWAKIEELLPKILDRIGERGIGEADAIFRFWRALLGEKMASMTECISWVDGILTVKVRSATLYSLLCQHEKARLLKQLREKFPVRNIIFRVG